MPPFGEPLDLRGVPCPNNAARVLLRLEAMGDGEVLDVVLDDGEPTQNVPRTVEDEGHQVLSRTRTDDGRWLLRIQKAG